MGILNCQDIRKSPNMTKKKRRSKESKLRRYMKALMRLLSKTRDLYVHGMTECSGHFSHMDPTMGLHAGHLSTLPSSFSFSSTSSSASDRDLKELVSPAASNRSHGNVEFDLIGRKQHAAVAVRVPRSRSFVIGRIDEDKPCDFDDDINVMPHIYPRGTSYAVHGREGRVF